MIFFANEGKNIETVVSGKTYLRHAIKTRFIKQGEKEQSQEPRKAQKEEQER